MDDPRETEQLQSAQLERERTEKQQALDAVDEHETAQHERRAEKARYLREKLKQRAESEADSGSD